MLNPFRSRKTSALCPSCGEEKPLSYDFFHSDISKPSGFSPICKSCRNIKRVKKSVAKPTKVKPVKIPVLSEDETEPMNTTEKAISPTLLDTWAETNILSQLSDKLGATFTITIQRNGKSFLQCHSTPALHYKARTPEELLKQIL